MGKRKLTIPADLAYGDEGTPDGLIKPGATLKFDVELVSINGNMSLTGALGYSWLVRFLFCVCVSPFSFVVSRVWRSIYVLE